MVAVEIQIKSNKVQVMFLLYLSISRSVKKHIYRKPTLQSLTTKTQLGKLWFSANHSYFEPAPPHFNSFKMPLLHYLNFSTEIHFHCKWIISECQFRVFVVHEKDKSSSVTILNRLSAVMTHQFLEMMNTKIIIVFLLKRPSNPVSFKSLLNICLLCI